MKIATRSSIKNTKTVYAESKNGKETVSCIKYHLNNSRCRMFWIKSSVVKKFATLCDLCSVQPPVKSAVRIDHSVVCKTCYFNHSVDNWCLTTQFNQYLTNVLSSSLIFYYSIRPILNQFFIVFTKFLLLKLTKIPSVFYCRVTHIAFPLPFLQPVIG